MIIKEFWDFVKPSEIGHSEQLETKILQELQMLGYYPLTDEELDIIKNFSTRFIDILKSKRNK